MLDPAINLGVVSCQHNVGHHDPKVHSRRIGMPRWECSAWACHSSCEHAHSVMFRFANTRSGLSSSSAASAHAEFLASDELLFKDVRNFYRCMPEVPDVLGQPRASPGACGSFGQACCNTGDLATRCGSGLACNLGTLSDPTGSLASNIFSANDNGIDFNVSTDSSRCEECGRQDQLCCPALVPEMKHGVCDVGMGCTNDIAAIVDRKCKPCGAQGAPCCWDLQHGFTCSDEMRCSGIIGGAVPCCSLHHILCQVLRGQSSTFPTLNISADDQRCV